jgi:hypothetical protein
VSSRRWLAASLVAAFAAVGGSSALAQALPPGSEDCVAKIKALSAPDAQAVVERNGGSSMLGEVCPDVAAALAENPWGEALAGFSPDDLETDAFLELTTLVAGYQRPPGDAERPALPRAAALDDALAELKLEKPAALTIWQRIQQWYEEHFGASGDAARGWLERWLQRFAPPEKWVRYFVILLGIVLAAVTIAIVYNELRVAGVLGRGMLRKYSPLAPSAPGSEPPRVRDFDDIARAPLARRPVLLLALVLERLRARGGLSLRDSLTHRELLGAARLDARQSAAFGAVLDAAERVTFADWRPVDQEVDPVLARGRELLSSLPVEAARK